MNDHHTSEINHRTRISKLPSILILMKIVSIIFVKILFCSIGFGQNTPPPKPFILGVTHVIHSNILNENRTLNIYLPDGYQENDTASYPVIYLLDGAADEDFIHVVGLIQFYTFPWIEQVPNSIVVGIANTDRRRDFTYPSTFKSDIELSPTSGHSDTFIFFLEKELQPYIRKTFRTTSSRMIIGQSLGGLLATEILFKKPTLFDKYLIISPSLWWDDASLLKLKPELLKPDFQHTLDIYIGVGKEGLGPGEIPHVMEVDANVLADMIKSSESKNVRVYFDYLPDKDHATIGHQAVSNGLQILYKK